MINFVKFTAVKAILHLKVKKFCPYFLHLLFTMDKIWYQRCLQKFLKQLQIS